MPIKDEECRERDLRVDDLKNRGDIREFILAEWAKESAGKKYRYFVEILSDGKRIYLERPGRFKGCDFVILVEDRFLYKNGYDRPPKHEDLLDDLRKKKNFLDQKSWQHLITAIESVHKITPCDIPLNSKNKINKVTPMRLEHIQLLCKWFFIEQDIAYWSGEGRDMLFNAIKSI